MQIMWRSISVAAGVALILVGTSTAHAQWVAHVKGPDVFGSTTVVASVGSVSQNGLVIQCSDKDSLDLAYLSPATESERDSLSKAESGVPVQLLVKVDRGAVQTFDAELRGWNNSYVGVVVSGRTPDMISLIRAIGTATSDINVGVEAAGNRQSESFGVIGSGNAIETVIKNCKLGDIKP